MSVKRDGAVGDDQSRGFLGDQIVVELRRMIVTGTLAPGERIIERDVAARLGTSRGPVRDAIRTLQHEGLVEVTPYAGACVTEIDRDEVDEIVALRRQVEYFAVAGAAVRGTEQDLERLRELAAGMRVAFAEEAVDDVLDLDLAFHLAICESSRHHTLVVAMRTLHSRLAILFYPMMLHGHTPESFERVHLDVVDAIDSGDVEASLAAIDEHLDSFYTDVELQIDSGVRRKQPEYLKRIEPARPVLVRRRRASLD